ncbi:MAG: hypothetical protein V3W04_12440 [Gammaproteobacteria bacterium]
MIRKIFWVALASLSILVSMPAWSKKGISYSYADFLYRDVQGDEEFIDTKSVLAKGSFAVHDYVHLLLGLERGTSDEFPGDTPDITEFSVGIGGNFDFSKSVSTYLDGFWFDTKINGNQTTIDQGGYRGELGLRYQVNKPVELNPYYLYVGSDTDDGFFGLRLQVRMTKKFNLHLGYEVDDDNNHKAATAGFRLNF